MSVCSCFLWAADALVGAFCASAVLHLTVVFAFGTCGGGEETFRRAHISFMFSLSAGGNAGMYVSSLEECMALTAEKGGNALNFRADVGYCQPQVCACACVPCTCPYTSVRATALLSLSLAEPPCKT